MTREEAIRRANELGGAAVARPYEFCDTTREWTEWGVTDVQNFPVPTKHRGPAFTGYQKRFMEK